MDSETAQQTGTALRARPWRAMLFMAILAAFIFGALAAAWPQLTGTNDQPRIDALEAILAEERANQANLQARLETAEERLETIARNIPGLDGEGRLSLDQRLALLEQSGTANAQALAALGARLGSVEAATPADLPQRLQGFALRTDQVAIEARLRQLETVRQAASLLALARLARAAEGAQSFAREFEVIASIAPGDPSVQVLRPLAARGVATKASLIGDFPRAARNAVNAERAALINGIWDRITNWVAQSIGWRRVGDIPGQSSEARLARAQVALNGGDLEAAIGETGLIVGRAQTAIALWLREARARIAVDNAINDIDQRVMRSLATQQTPAPGR